MNFNFGIKEKKLSIIILGAVLVISVLAMSISLLIPDAKEKTETTKSVASNAVSGQKEVKGKEGVVQINNTSNPQLGPVTINNNNADNVLSAKQTSTFGSTSTTTTTTSTITAPPSTNTVNGTLKPTTNTLSTSQQPNSQHGTNNGSTTGQTNSATTDQNHQNLHNAVNENLEDDEEDIGGHDNSSVNIDTNDQNHSNDSTSGTASNSEINVQTSDPKQMGKSGALFGIGAHKRYYGNVLMTGFDDKKIRKLIFAIKEKKDADAFSTIQNPADLETLKNKLKLKERAEVISDSDGKIVWYTNLPDSVSVSAADIKDNGLKTVFLKIRSKMTIDNVYVLVEGPEAEVNKFQESKD